MTKFVTNCQHKMIDHSATPKSLQLSNADHDRATSIARVAANSRNTSHAGSIIMGDNISTHRYSIDEALRGLNIRDNGSVCTSTSSRKPLPEKTIAISQKVKNFEEWLKEKSESICLLNPFDIATMSSCTFLSSYWLRPGLTGDKIEKWYNACKEKEDIVPLISADYIKNKKDLVWTASSSPSLQEVFRDSVKMIMYPSRMGFEKSTFDNNLLDDIKFQEIMAMKLNNTEMMMIYVMAFNHQMSRISPVHRHSLAIIIKEYWKGILKMKGIANPV